MAKPDHTIPRDLHPAEVIQSEIFPVFPNVILDIQYNILYYINIRCEKT